MTLTITSAETIDMTTIAPPQVRCSHGVFVVELGSDYSHLYESLVEHLAILSLLADSAASARLVLDLSNVDFIGSALIGQLVATSRKLTARNGAFALASVNKYCRTAINLTGLKSMLPTYESTEAAVNELSSR